MKGRFIMRRRMRGDDEKTRRPKARASGDAGAHRVWRTTRSQYNLEGEGRGTHLVETDGGRLLAEALTAEVKAVLADETGLVGAEAAVGGRGTVSTVRTRRCLGPQFPSFSPSLFLILNPFFAFFLPTYPPFRQRETGTHH